MDEKLQHFSESSSGIDGIKKGGTDDSSSSSGNSSGSSDEGKREKWSHQLDFILSCIGFAVGLGNVWRFPYLCYENGGGAFLVPYVIMLFVAGLPLFYLELAFGQFASLGAIAVWKISPLFTGVGIGMIIIAALVCIYYNVIIAWTIYYLIRSCTTEALPWSTCGHEWNTDRCYNESMNYIKEESENLTRPSDEFWHRQVHQLTEGIHDIGGIRLELLGCLALAWLIVYLCVFKGIKSSGKVVYFTALFPYVVLIILLGRGASLPGAGLGVEYYIKPKFEYLLDPKPWKDAANQIFYSLGISFGSLTTMASFNRFHNNCQRDALIVSLCNCGTSILAGFVVFSTLGFMAEDSNRKIDEVAASGPGLVFIVYPEALAKMEPVPQLWSVLFFLMLLTLGLDSMFAMMETVTTAVMDALPYQYRRWKWLIILVACCIGFLLGIPLVTQGGLYLLTIVNDYAGGFSLMVISICYCVAICYVYGLNRFGQDIKSMLGSLPNIYWKACWAVLSPLALVAIVIASFIFYAPSGYDGKVFPPWAQGLGWILTLLSFVTIPVYAIFAVFFRADRSFSILDRLKVLLRPTWDWGPTLDKHRIEAGYDPLPVDGTPPSQLELKSNGFLESKKPSIALISSSSMPPQGDIDSQDLYCYDQAVQVDLD
ncbi:sodium- and chloride-dependent glycine transporter 1-like isoform X2 [Acanthaster planci]|uniref:Transporter n=1 Tax=Acanthaster planci TaxID=133434 RepID=A0A8B7XFJ7_ACAPL|nr:sodium- and chloride-dependent glycine transporter 1-like isoform X2 [Acanthaster planci]